MFYSFDAIMFYCTVSEMTRIKMINRLWSNTPNLISMRLENNFHSTFVAYFIIFYIIILIFHSLLLLIPALEILKKDKLATHTWFPLTMLKEDILYCTPVVYLNKNNRVFNMSALRK